MKKLLFLLLFLTPLFSFNSAHKFYVSVTEIEYSPENEALQIIVHVFADDFQKLLQKRYDPTIVLLEGKEIPETNRYIKTYFKEKFVVSLYGKNQPMDFIGKRYEKDSLVLYFEIAPVKEFSKITVQNQLLTELFEDQKNLVHVEHFGKTKSLLLTKNEPIGTINFKK